MPSSQALLLKARSLFPVPPGNNPYITLDQGDDQAVVLLEDALPYLRDREGLVFRWSPDTPRKCTGNRVKWVESVASGSDSSKSSSSSSTAPLASSSNSNSRAESTTTPAPQASPPGLSPPKAISPTQHRTQAQQHRAAHAKRVLEEQRRIMEEERLEREEAAARERREAEERERAEQQKQKEELERRQEKEAETQAGDSKMESQVEVEQQQDGQEEQTTRQAVETPKTSSSSQETHAPDVPLQQPAVAAAAEQQEESQQSTSITASTEQQPAAVPQSTQAKPTEASTQDFMLPGSSPPPYSSPHVPRADVLRDVTPPSGRQDEQDMSSPLAPSPTREVYAAVAKASMSPHSDKLVAGSSPRAAPTEIEQQPEFQATSFTPSESRPSDAADDADEEMDSDTELENSALLQSSSSESSTPSPRKNEREEQQQTTDHLYRSMALVVENLCNHPGNSAFRGSMPAEFLAHAHSISSLTAICVDLPTIRSKVAQRQYGNSDVSPSPLLTFQADLKRLFGLARSFYGARSPQGQSATVLEKFAEVVIAAYTVRPASGPRSSSVLAPRKTPINADNSSSRAKSAKVDDKEESRRKAAALMASWQSGPAPTARGEKRPYCDDGVSQSKQGRGRLNHKQPKLTFGTKEKASATKTADAVDMAAFHRAIMGTDRVPSSLTRTTSADQLATAAIASNAVGPASREEKSQPEAEQAVNAQETEEPSKAVDEPMQPIAIVEPEAPSRMTTRRFASKEASRSEDDTISSSSANDNPRQQQQKTSSTPSLRPRRRGLGSLATAAAVAGTAFISTATAAWTGGNS